MGDFGRSLHQFRESQGLSPERVFAATRVPVRHLIALESEQFQLLPSDASGRGFVRLLARLYKVDEQTLVRQYDEARTAVAPVSTTPLSQTNATIFKAEPSGRGHMGLSAGVGAVILVLLALGWMRGNQGPLLTAAIMAPVSPAQEPVRAPAARRAPESAPRAEEPAPAEAAAPTQPATITGNAAAPAAQSPAMPAPPAISADALSFRLEIQANEQSWVQAAMDGAEVKEALLQPGERLQWDAADMMDVTLGNAGGLVLMLNGESVPVLGEPGQVVRLHVTKNGIEKVRRFRTTPRPEALPAASLAF